MAKNSNSKPRKLPPSQDPKLRKWLSKRATKALNQALPEMNKIIKK